MRFVKGVAALITLCLSLVGIPVALATLGGNPVPDSFSWSAVSRALFQPDDGTVVIGLITVIGWIAWSVFALSVAAEVVAVLSGFRLQVRLPGLAGPQRLVAGLLLSVIAIAATPQAVHADSTPTSGPIQPYAQVDVPGSPQRAAPPVIRTIPKPSAPAKVTTPVKQETVEAPRTVHVVKQGDDLWSLAEHYYGQGKDWRKIATANPQLLTGGPDRLSPGWKLTIPDATSAAPMSDARTVVVEPGDSLTSIAEESYGKPSSWAGIFEANRAQIAAPDEVDVGTRLILPGKPAQPAKTTPVPNHPKRPSTGSGNGNAKPKPTTLPDPVEGPTREPASEPKTTTLPEANASTLPEPVEGPPATEAVPAPTEQHASAALGLASVGGLLAAGLIGGLVLRRRLQLQARPLGRRIVHPPPPVQAVEAALGRRQKPLSLRTLDLAIRAVAAHCHHTAGTLPPLSLVKIGDDSIELIMTEQAVGAPVGFTVSGRSWILQAEDAAYLKSVPGVGEAARPFPALVSLGRDDQGNQVLADLESLGLLALDTNDTDLAEGVLAAMAVELSFSLWADEMILTLVGSQRGLPDALGRHNVTYTDNVDGLLDRLEQRAAVQRSHQPHKVLGQHRVDPDLADPWAPEIVLVSSTLSPEQERRLVEVGTSDPRVTLAVVVAGAVKGAPWSLELLADARADSESPPGQPDAAAQSVIRGVLQPIGLALVPQRLDAAASVAVQELVTVTGREDTTPAPWWSHPGDPPPDTAEPDNVTYLGRRFGGWGASSDQEETGQEGSGTVEHRIAGTGSGTVHHPTLRMLGPIELLGAAGTVPGRAAKQCLEYCGWLLERPGTTAQTMTAALVVAEGTRRSNVSRLRSWLGANAAGEAYLPDAYTGRILLHPSVSSDWQRLQILTAAGVNKTSTSGLSAALELVRGAPLADAAPGQWHWAEELRTDMASVIRDIGVEVTQRALVDNDIDLARWAAARALVAAPGDELLMSARIRTEHQAGNPGETERLTLQLASHARMLGLDLDPDTVVLLQQVMEGRARARLA